METKKQPNRIYLTSEQRKNKSKSNHKYYLNHLAYFRPGGNGYESINRTDACPHCGFVCRATNLKRHQESKCCKK